MLPHSTQYPLALTISIVGVNKMYNYNPYGNGNMYQTPYNAPYAPQNGNYAPQTLVEPTAPEWFN